MVKSLFCIGYTGKVKGKVKLYLNPQCCGKYKGGYIQEMRPIIYFRNFNGLMKLRGGEIQEVLVLFKLVFWVVTSCSVTVGHYRFGGP
jgi:hypothetical protein